MKKIENKIFPPPLSKQKVEKNHQPPQIRSADNKKEEQLDKGRRDFLRAAALGALLAVAGRIKWSKLLKENKNEENKNKKDQKPQQQPRVLSKVKSSLPANSQDQTEVVLKKSANQPTTEKESLAPTVLDKADNKIIQIAQGFKKAYYEITAKPEFFPADIFSPDLFIAQQLQESGYNKKAHSRANAVGVMQVRTNAIKDIVRYLNILKRRGQINSFVPAKPTAQETAEILKLAEEDADLGRVIGKIYMAMLFNHYQVGRKDYRRGQVKKAQKIILAAYNGGYSRIKYRPEKFWPRESRQYYRRIFAYMEKLKIVRQSLKKLKLNLTNENYAAMLIVKKISSVKSASGQKIILNQCLKELSLAWREKARTGEKSLSDKEIDLALEKITLDHQPASV